MTTRTRIPHPRHVLIFLALGVVACGGGGGAGLIPQAAADAAADFQLIDQNPNSASYGADISVREQLGRVSAWYFGTTT